MSESMQKRILGRLAEYKYLKAADPAARRAALLARQHEIRASKADKLRQLLALAQRETVVDATSEVTTGMVFDARSSSGFDHAIATQATELHHVPVVQQSNNKYASQIQIPEWLIAIPPDLGTPSDAGAATEWFVMPRPSGVQCLLVACGGKTAVWDIHGRLLAKLETELPGGSAATKRPTSETGSVLDCIFNEEKKLIFVMDILYWNACPAYEWQFEMRRWWLQHHLPDTGILGAGRGSAFERSDAVSGMAPMFGFIPETDLTPPAVVWMHSLHSSESSFNDTYVAEGEPQYVNVSFALVPEFPCTASGIEAAYSYACPVEMDGLLFANANADYIPGVCPLSLRWRDVHTSPMLATWLARSAESYEVTLMVDDTGNLRTVDGVCVGAAGIDCTPDALVICAVSNVVVDETTGNAMVEGLTTLRLAARDVFHADSWSCILFQSQLRSGSACSIADVTAVAQRRL